MRRQIGYADLTASIDVINRAQIFQWSDDGSVLLNDMTHEDLQQVEKMLIAK